jgi:hypothetical protein
MADDTRRNNLVVAAIALAATITSLRNGFAYDDIPIIATNERVHHLASWWSFFGTSYWPPQYGESLYRPVSMLAYALEWAVGNGSSMVFHAVSIALFVLLAILVLMLLRELLEERAALLAGPGRTRFTPRRWPTSLASRSCWRRSASSVQRSSTSAREGLAVPH